MGIARASGLSNDGFQIMENPEKNLSFRARKAMLRPAATICCRQNLHISADFTPSASSNLRECLLEVANKIANILNSDAKSNQAVVNPKRFAHLCWN